MGDGQLGRERGEDPELFTRWLTIAHLLTSAEELQARGGWAWPSLAIVAADAATEAMLGLVANASANPPSDRAKFEDILSVAVDELRLHGGDISTSLRTRTLASHRARNAAIHEGTSPGANTVNAAIKAAIELRDLIAGTLDPLAPFGGAGPVRAIATIVDFQPISVPLAEAERLLTEGSFTQAADHAAIALDAALARVKPPLRGRPSRMVPTGSFRGKFSSPTGVSTGWPSPLGAAERQLDTILGNLRDQLTHHEAWILAGGLGMRPAELAELQRVLGTPWRGGTVTVQRDEKVTLTREVVESALLRTADLVYRLWQGGSLDGS